MPGSAYTLAFSSTGDPSIGTIGDLTARVKRIITAAAELDLPDEPPLPALTIRSLTQLGTLTAERKRLLDAAIEEAEGKNATWAEEIKLERTAPRSSKAKSAPRQPRQCTKHIGGGCTRVVANILSVVPWAAVYLEVPLGETDYLARWP